MKQHPGPCIDPAQYCYEAGNVAVYEWLCEYCADVIKESGTAIFHTGRILDEAATMTEKQRKAIDAWSKRFPDPRPGFPGI